MWGLSGSGLGDGRAAPKSTPMGQLLLASASPSAQCFITPSSEGSRPWGAWKAEPALSRRPPVVRRPERKRCRRSVSLAALTCGYSRDGLASHRPPLAASRATRRRRAVRQPSVFLVRLATPPHREAGFLGVVAERAEGHAEELCGSGWCRRSAPGAKMVTSAPAGRGAKVLLSLPASAQLERVASEQEDPATQLLLPGTTV